MSRVVCELVCFRRRRASAIDLPLAKSPRRCPREGAAGLLCPGRARWHPEWRARARAGSLLRKHSSFLPPSRYARSRRTGLGLCFFFSSSFREEKKKNAPVQSFLRLPARGSEDNITYVIYMHIKSLAGVCECRKILCEEEEEKKAAQSGRARREAPRCDSQKTRSSWWKCACTWPGRVSLLLGRAWAARGEAAVPGGRHRGRLALLAQNGLQCSLLTCP